MYPFFTLKNNYSVIAVHFDIPQMFYFESMKRWIHSKQYLKCTVGQEQVVECWTREEKKEFQSATKSLHVPCGQWRQVEPWYSVISYFFRSILTIQNNTTKNFKQWAVYFSSHQFELISRKWWIMAIDYILGEVKFSNMDCYLMQGLSWIKIHSNQHIYVCMALLR